MIPRAAVQHAREARALIKEEGVASYVRKLPGRLSRLVFWHQAYLIWRADMPDLSLPLVPRREDWDFRVISEPEDLDRLLEEGVSVDPSFGIDAGRRMLAGHLVGFVIVVDKELAWWAWAATEDKSQYFVVRPPRNVDYSCEVYMGRGTTSPRHRRLGVHNYGCCRLVEYWSQMGKPGVIFSTPKDPGPETRSYQRLGSCACGQIECYRVLLLWNHWVEKWYDAT